MTANDSRSYLSVRRNRDAELGMSAVRRLLSRAGLCRGAVGREVASGNSVEFENLENRVLLAGDQPGLSLFPDSELLVLNGGTGEVTFAGEISPALDDDVFSFVALADDFVTVFADTVTPVSDLNSRVEVYIDDPDNPGTPLLIDAQSGNGTLSAGTPTDGWVGFVSEIGETYYVRILSDVVSGTGATGAYMLRIDGLSTALAVDPSTGEGVVAANVTIEGVDTVYRVETGAGTEFDSLATAVAATDLAGGDPVDPHVEVYNSIGELVANDEESGHLSDAFDTWRSGSSGTFYVRVRGDAFVLGDAMATGAYELTVDMIATEVPLDAVTRRGMYFDPAIEVGVAKTSLITFTSQGSGLAILTAIGVGLPPVDTATHLFNDEGVRVAFNDNGTPSEIQRRIEGGDVYYAVIEGFDDGFSTPYVLYIESNHTFDDGGSGSDPIDDHIDTPPIPDPDDEAAVEAARRQRELSTPIVFGDPYLLQDRWENDIRDHAYAQTGLATGRIHGIGDTDLFAFTPPLDMLREYPGNNDDVGLALYAGGPFTAIAGDQPANYVGIWDAEDWFFAGPGFNDAVRAFTVWDPDGEDGDEFASALIAGGDFTSSNGDDMFFISQLDILTQEWLPVGDPVFGPIISPDDTVRAMTTFDHDGDESTPDALILGGDFTSISGVAVTNLAAVYYDPIFGAWAVDDLGGGFDGPVYSLMSWDPPGEWWDGTELVEMTPELVVGGSFTAPGTNIARFFQEYPDDPESFTWDELSGGGTDGPVFGLTTLLQDLDDDGTIGSEEITLVAAGNFTTAGGTAANNIAQMFWSSDGGNAESVYTWVALGAGTDGPIYALEPWDVDGDPETLPAIIAGGSFTTPGANIAMFDADTRTWAAMGDGMDDVVRTLEVLQDSEFGVPAYPMVHAGGDFTMADSEAASHVARWIFDPIDGWIWQALGDGTDAPIYSLFGYDDDSEFLWDRHDRIASRVSITVSPQEGSFINTYIRIYDSNFEEVLYENNTIAPPFPDPSGSYDQSLLSPESDADDLIGIELWGGEVYFIEISSVSAATGRYSYNITIDALPEDGIDGDPIGDGIYVDRISTITEHPDEGSWASAPEMSISASTGDTRNYVNAGADPFHGNFIRTYRANPSAYLSRESGDLGVIQHIGDTDLYFFRAPAAGTVEVRIATTQISDEYHEEQWNLNTLVRERSTVKTKTYDSWLDSAIRVFNNDFEQLAYNTENHSMEGERETAFVGTFGDRTFTRRDGRAYFEVEEANVYFIQVESGQRAAFLAGDIVDWRHAIGSYELLISATGAGDDDHANSQTLGSSLPIDPDTGDGALVANIETAGDADVFSYTAEGAGPITITATASDGATLLPIIRVFDIENNLLASASSTSEGIAIVDTLSVTQGERLFIQIFGSGVSTGEYSLTLEGPELVDDVAHYFRWDLAEEVEIVDFLGTGVYEGSIEITGDIDIFAFTTPGYDLASASVLRMTSTFNPFVRVYEVSEDPAGNAILLQIGTNDDVSESDPDSQAFFPITAPDRTSLLTGNTYNTYYVIVSGSDPDTDKGDYRLIIETTPTDDHPDVGQFAEATATAIVSSTGVGSQSGILENISDSDLIRFVAPAGGSAVVTTTSAEGSLVRPTMAIFGSDFVQIGATLTGDDSVAGTPSTITAQFDVVRGQTYYVLVDGASGFNREEIGAFEMDISTPTVDDHANVGEFGLATVIPLVASTGDGAGFGIIGAERDTDMFVFTTKAAGDVVLDVTTPDITLTPRIRVYDQSLTLIADVTAGAAGDPVTYTIVSALDDTEYYVLVSGAANAEIGNFAMTIDGAGNSSPPPTFDDDHANEGDFVNATVIVLAPLTGDGASAGGVDESGDTDLFTFTTLAAGRVFVQVVTPNGALIDTSIRIFDSSETAIFYDVVGLPGVNANVEFTAATPGEKYYILVDGIDSAVGSYMMRVDTEPTTHYAYYPEGYAGPNIREYVSLANSNEFDVSYQVILRYSTGTLESIVATGTLSAGSRGGVTLSDGPAGVLAGVRIDTPYSIIVESTEGPIGATFAHYDFDQAVGESFTTRTSDIWTFAMVERSPGAVNDFMVIYNPNATQSLVTMTVYNGDGSTIEFTQVLDGFRRGGFDFDALTDVPFGNIGVKITSEPANAGDDHIGVVAALTHYDTAENEGFTALGDPDGGTTFGVIPSLTQGDVVSSELALFNPGSSSASVTIVGSYINVDLPDVLRTIDLAPGGVQSLTGLDLGMTKNQPLGLRFEANVPVTVMASQSQHGDADASAAISEVGTGFFFGDAFMNSEAAGDLYYETLNFYNPFGEDSLAIEVKFLFLDGTSATRLVNVGPDSFASLDLHEEPLILNHGELNFFSIEVTGASPFAVTMNHYDLFLTGGWTSGGAPLGLLNPIEDIIS